MALPPGPPPPGGFAPGPPRCASASSEAGFARLPRKRRPSSLRDSCPIQSRGFAPRVLPSVTHVPGQKCYPCPGLHTVSAVHASEIACSIPERTRSDQFLCRGIVSCVGIVFLPASHERVQKEHSNRLSEPAFWASHAAPRVAEPLHPHHSARFLIK